MRKRENKLKSGARVCVRTDSGEGRGGGGAPGGKDYKSSTAAPQSHRQ